MKIVSVLLGVISLILLIAAALIAYTGLYALVIAKGSNAETVSITLIIAIILTGLGLLCALSGIVLAIIGLFGQSPNKLPVFIGLGLNLLVIISFGGVMIYGIYYLLANVKGRPFG